MNLKENDFGDHLKGAQMRLLFNMGLNTSAPGPYENAKLPHPTVDRGGVNSG